MGTFMITMGLRFIPDSLLFNGLHAGGTLFHSTVTCKDLTKPSEVEKSTLRHGEQLTQEDQKGD